MDSSRVLIAVILSIVLVVAYQELVLKRFFPPPTQQQQQQAAEQAKAAKAAQAQALGNGLSASATGVAAPGAVATGAVATGAVESGQQSVAMAPSAAVAAERTVEVDSDFYVAVFTTRGARLKSFTLRRYRQNAAKDSPPYEMVQIPPGGHLPLGAVMTRGGQVFDDRDLSYETSAPAQIKPAAGADATATFAAKTADGTAITKTFTFRASSYVFSMDVAVAAGAAAAGAALNQLGVSMSQPLTAHQGYYDIPELQADVADKVVTKNEKALKSLKTGRCRRSRGRSRTRASAIGTFWRYFCPRRRRPACLRWRTRVTRRSRASCSTARRESTAKSTWGRNCWRLWKR